MATDAGRHKSSSFRSKQQDTLPISQE
jgi:hypothetical protein